MALSNVVGDVTYGLLVQIYCLSVTILMPSNKLDHHIIFFAGHNRVSNKKLGLDICLGGTRHPHRDMTNRLGVARLTTGMWQVGDAGARKWRQ